MYVTINSHGDTRKMHNKNKYELDDGGGGRAGVDRQEVIDKTKNTQAGSGCRSRGITCISNGRYCVTAVHRKQKFRRQTKTLILQIGIIDFVLLDVEKFFSSASVQMSRLLNIFQ